MDRLERRRQLATRPDPDPRMDYVITLGGRITGEVVAEVEVRYVPDRLIIDPAGFESYLRTLSAVSWSSLEEVGGAILDDVNNEAVARWVQVSITAVSGNHSVLFEDRQPRWDNPQLLGRLRRH